MKTVFRRKWYLFVPLILVAFIGFGFFTMWLWNSLMPLIFHLPKITFWQTAGLMLLSRLLIGGFGGHGHSRGHHHCKSNIHEKWEKMTLEERIQFKENIHFHRPPWMDSRPQKENAKES